MRPRFSTTMHKIDLGFHHHNVAATTPSRLGLGPAGHGPTSRAGSGHLLQHGNQVMLTCSVRHAAGSEFTVCCLPVEDNGGLLDLSGQDPTDAIVGDQLTAADVDEAKQAAALKTMGLPSPNPASDRPTGSPRPSAGSEDINLAHAIRARIPKGDLAHNAAFCEPMPGDPPGRLTDDDIAALRGQPGPQDLDTLRAVSGGGRQAEGSASSSSSNSSASAPGQVKEVVKDETLKKDPKYNEF